MSPFLSISEAAEISGLGAHTLRYYEKIGLIAPVGRRGGARRFGPEDMRWLEFLNKLRATGMALREMRRYAELRRAGDSLASVSERRALLAAHASRMRAQMDELADTLAYVERKVDGYDEIERKLARG